MNHYLNIVLCGVSFGTAVFLAYCITGMAMIPKVDDPHFRDKMKKQSKMQKAAPIIWIIGIIVSIIFTMILF